MSISFARIYMHAVAYTFALFPICRPSLCIFSPVLIGNPGEISVVMSANQTKMFNDVDGGIYQAIAAVLASQTRGLAPVLGRPQPPRPA
jgi:hypothetical protein